MPIIYFFILWLLLLIIGGGAINGFYNITRGEYEDLVDGTRRQRGKIFKGWYFFWFKEKEENQLTQYKGKYLIGIYNQIQNICTEAKISVFTTRLVVEKPMIDMTSHLEDKLNIKIVIEKEQFGGRDNYYMYIYKSEPAYVFPDWVRTVLAGCITCFSSVYGSIVFFTFHMLAYSKLNYIYAWSDYFYPAFIVTWISSLIIWGYINPLLYKIGRL